MTPVNEALTTKLFKQWAHGLSDSVTCLSLTISLKNDLNGSYIFHVACSSSCTSGAAPMATTMLPLLHPLNAHSKPPPIT